MPAVAAIHALCGAASSCWRSTTSPSSSTPGSRIPASGDVAKDKKVYFVCVPRGKVDAVEVADWAALDRRKATAPARALPGRPSLVASRDEFDFGKSANVVPAALLLWALSG